MTRSLALAANTFLELARSKLLYLLLVFSLLLILGSVFLAQLTIGQWERIIKDVGLATVHLSGALVAVMVGVGLIAGEVERKTVYVTLSKPVARWEFVVGRYLGLCAVLLLLVAAMGGALTLVLRGVGESLGPTGLYALILIFVELGLLAGIAVMFSTFTTTTLATIFSASLFAIGHAAGDLGELAARSESAWRPLFTVIARVVPNLELLNLKTHAANVLPVEPSFVVSAAAYGLGYSAVLLVVASFLFARRDLK